MTMNLQSSPHPVLLLYTTLGCHLCEQAKTLSWPVLEHFGYRLHSVEIADDPHLLERYALRIPVVARADTGAELGWPFTREQLAVLLAPV
jgi:hypothetical protein